MQLRKVVYEGMYQAVHQMSGRPLYMNKVEAEVDKWIEDHKDDLEFTVVQVVKEPTPGVPQGTEVPGVVVPPATAPNELQAAATIEPPPPAKKIIHKYSFDMVDSYRYEGKGVKTRDFEGENVGISGVVSTIAVALRVDFDRQEDGTTMEKIVFIPHTFINSMTHTAFYEKDSEKKT